LYLRPAVSNGLLFYRNGDFLFHGFLFFHLLYHRFLFLQCVTSPLWLSIAAGNILRGFYFQALANGLIYCRGQAFNLRNHTII